MAAIDSTTTTEVVPSGRSIARIRTTLRDFERDGALALIYASQTAELAGRMLYEHTSGARELDRDALVGISSTLLTMAHSLSMRSEGQQGQAQMAIVSLNQLANLMRSACDEQNS